MNTSEYIKSLLTKAGVNAADEKFKVFFDTPELAKIEVPEDITKGIDNNLISLTSAKDNYAPLKNHYTALALNGVDSALEGLTDEIGLSDDDKTELKLERSTGKRVGLLIKKAQALENKKANADKPDRAAIQKQIDELHAQIRAANNKAIEAENSFKQKEKDLRLNYALTNLFGNHKTVFDNLTSEIRNTSLRTVVQMDLQSKKAKFDFDDQGNLIILNADGTNYFGPNNEPVNPTQFVEQSLSKNQILAVNKPQPQNGPDRSKQDPKIITSKDADGKPPIGQSSVFQELMGNANKDFKNINGVVQP